jgi:hypothetical protein
LYIQITIHLHHDLWMTLKEIKLHPHYKQDDGPQQPQQGDKGPQRRICRCVSVLQARQGWSSAELWAFTSGAKETFSWCEENGHRTRRSTAPTPMPCAGE